MAYLAGSLFRKYMINFDKKRQEKQVFPSEIIDNVDVIEDIDFIGKNNKYQYLDINIPKKITGQVRPVIIDFHGGAYYHGEKLINKFYVKYIAIESEMYVVNANYRLISKGVNIFDQLQDMLDAISFVYDNAEKYNFDKNNIFLTGDSAGAHILGMAINAINNSEYKNMLKVNINESVNINAVAFTCGLYSFDDFKDIFILRPFMKDIIDRKYRKNNIADLTNVYKFYNHNCPVFISSSFGDFLNDQSKKAKEFFDENNIECEFVYWDKPIIEGRKLEHVFNILFPDYEESIKTNKAFCDFIKKHIK